MPCECYIPKTTMAKNTPALAPLTALDFTSAFPASRKVHVEGPGVQVPMREISLTNGETLRVYDTSGPQGCDVREGLPKLRKGWIAARAGGGGVTQLFFARKGIVTPEMEFVAIREGFDPGFVRSEVARGRSVSRDRGARFGGARAEQARRATGAANCHGRLRQRVATQICRFGRSEGIPRNFRSALP